MEDKYEKLNKVGEGAYGEVYKARDKKTGQLVALKKYLLKIDEEGIPSSTLHEISLVQMLSDSIYIVKLIGVEHIHHNVKPRNYLVFEYLDNDLKKFINAHRKGTKPSPLPTYNYIRRFLFQLCKDVAYIHSHGALHRDLKPENLLIDQRKEILKIADLGLGREFIVPLLSYTHEIVNTFCPGAGGNLPTMSIPHRMNDGIRTECKGSDGR